MKKRTKIKQLLTDAGGLRWPCQILLFAAVYYVVPALLEIIIGGDLLNAIAAAQPRLWENDASRNIIFNAADTVMNFLSIGALLLTFRWMNKDKSLSCVGLPKLGKREAARLTLGLAAGAGAISAAILGEAAMGFIKLEKAGPTVWSLLMFLMLVSAAALEEVFIRGVLQFTLDRHTGTAAAVLIPSFVFGLIHLRNPSLSKLAMVNIILAGLFLALLTSRTRSLYAPIGFHITWNFFQGMVFGLPVSGNDLGGDPFWRGQAVRGADWLSGGTFGPEGTVWCTAVFILLITALLVCRKKKEPVTAI